MTNSRVDPLTKMLDDAERHARQEMIGTDRQLMPGFVLQDGNAHSYTVLTPLTGEESKIVTEAMIRFMIEQQKIVRYSFISEMWWIRRSDLDDGDVPSKAEDREECVLAIATDGRDYRSRRWQIKRKGARCTGLILDTKDDKEVQTGFGRFDNLLRTTAH